MLVGGSTPTWNTQVGASGPWPSTRYLTGGVGTFTLNLTAASTTAGTTVLASDHLGIINDNLVGGVTIGGDFCLDLVTGGLLEVWAGPLSGDRWAISLFNRYVRVRACVCCCARVSVIA
jgi:hypothetical protein